MSIIITTNSEPDFSFFVEMIIYTFANFMLCLQVVPAWLNCLPIKGDLIEAKVVHDQLCLMAERLGPTPLFNCLICYAMYLFLVF